MPFTSDASAESRSHHSPVSLVPLTSPPGDLALGAQSIRRGRAPLSLAGITLLAGFLIWIAPRSLQRSEDASSERPNRVTLDSAAVRDALARQQWPEGLSLPAFYRDPDLFLLPRERTAQSELVLFWSTRSPDEKVELLQYVEEAESLVLLPFVAEVAFFTAALEQDRLVGESLLSALHASCYDHLDLVHFVCDFMRVSTPVAEVRVHAASYVAALDERRRHLGR